MQSCGTSVLESGKIDLCRSSPPHERVQLLLQGNLVENNISNELLKYSTGNAAEKYIRDKLGLIHDDLRMLDWTALEKFQKMISKDHQATRSNFSYWRAVTATRNHTLYHQPNKCMQCGLVEDHMHVLMRRWPSTLAHSNLQIQQLKDKSVSLNTHLDLITIIILGTKTIGGLVLLDVHTQGTKISPIFKIW